MPRRGTEREDTDSSLRVERERADREYSERATSAATSTDRVVAAARDRARRVLAEARLHADETLLARGAGAGELADLASRRADHDAAVRCEDDRADAALASERAEVDRTLAGRGDFLAMVSHELGSTIASVAIYAAALRVKPRSDSDYAATAAALAPRFERAAAQMQRLVADLVDVASVEAGRFRVVRVDRDLPAAARDAVALAEPLAARKGVAIETSIEPGFTALTLDRDRIVQVLTNLLGNAVKFTPEGGRVSLRVEGDGEEGARVAVQDTGSGIAPEQLEGLFDRTWRRAGDHEDAAAARGLGLGLYISRHIVEAHGGRLWAESQPGAGATFRFTLPARVDARRPR